jgi:guanylate kinase
MIILIGESASGKSTIEKKLTEKKYSKIISYTTRPMRKGEYDGVDYHYISEDTFADKLKNNFFIEYTTYNGWHYGIAKEDCLDNSVVVVEPHGFRQLQKIKDLRIKSFYIKVTERERMIRMIKRGDNLMEVFRRIFSDQGVFQCIDEEVDYIVENNDLDQTVENILDTLNGGI